MFAASDGSARGREPRVEHLVRDLRLVSRRLITSTFASFQRRAPAAVSASVQSAARTPGDLVGRDRRAGSRPAEQHAGCRPRRRDLLADAPPDLGPLERLAGGRPDELDVGAPSAEVGGDRVGERRPLVGTEHDAHASRRLRAIVSAWDGSSDRPRGSSLAVAVVVAVGVARLARVGRPHRGRAPPARHRARGSALLGVAAAIAAAITGFLVLNSFFTEPTGSLKIDRSDDVVALVVFAVVGRARRLRTVQRLSTLRQLALRREHEARMQLDLTNRAREQRRRRRRAAAAARDARATCSSSTSCELRARREPARPAATPATPNVRVETGGVTLLARAPSTSPTPSDRALLEALVGGLATARRPAAAAGRGARRAARRRDRPAARRLPLGGEPQPAHAADRGEGGRGHAAVVVVAHRTRRAARAARDDRRRGRAARTARAQHARAEPHPRRRARGRRSNRSTSPTSCSTRSGGCGRSRARTACASTSPTTSPRSGSTSRCSSRSC